MIVLPPFLELLRQDYERTMDPHYAWVTYQACRRGIPVPGWVVEYFDQVAKAMCAAPDESEDWTKRFARALAPGFEPRGRRTFFEQHEKGWRDWLLARLVQEEIERGNSQVVAWEIVAEAEGPSPETVRNAWRANRDGLAWLRAHPGFVTSFRLEQHEKEMKEIIARRGLPKTTR
jgi:hypothetical protein